jgi:hypothetical protein
MLLMVLSVGDALGDRGRVVRQRPSPPAVDGVPIAGAGADDAQRKPRWDMPVSVGAVMRALGR